VNIVLTGAGGLLGAAVQSELTNLRWSVRKLPFQQIWQMSVAELAALLHGNDCVIHAAANTNVEQCEIDIGSCYRDNVLLTERLAQAARLAEVKLVFVSSTGIYGEAKQEPHAEYDEVIPTTHHHRSKYMAEQAVLRFNPLNLVVRTGWLFGGDRNLPKNFVARRIEEGIATQQVSGVLSSNAEQYGVPCYNVDVARRLLALAEGDYCGVFNCVNSGYASRFEYVRAIIELYGLDVEVKPATAVGFNRRARVSNNEMAINWRMDCMGLSPIPEWRDSLAAYIAILKNTDKKQ
jgi:dTDP-4-dehydrorhamnose reductase